MNEKTKKKLHEALNKVAHKYSDEAYDAVDNIIDAYEDGDDVYELVYQEVDGSATCMYYSDAFEYLKSIQQYDFEDAIKEGFGKNVCSIAYYYLEQEIFDILSDMEFDDIVSDADEDEEDE